jgi:gallate dioxygenase
MTGIATAIYEDDRAPEPPDAEYLAHITHQLAGMEKLSGTYPFTLARSVKGYRLNKFLHALIDPAWRDRFRVDQESLFETAALSEEERRLVRTLDWRGMIHYGVSFFMLEKLGAVVGVSNLHIYAAMRGETLEQFLKTRNAPGALYSVAGSPPAAFRSDQPCATMAHATQPT